MSIVSFGVNGVITERINTFIARILNPSTATDRETIGTDVNSLNGKKVRIRNDTKIHICIYLRCELWLTDSKCIKEMKVGESE